MTTCGNKIAKVINSFCFPSHSSHMFLPHIPTTALSNCLSKFDSQIQNLHSRVSGRVVGTTGQKEQTGSKISTI